MKLISFDIGIKNMAYCIFSLESNTLKILKWDILNLMNEEEKVQQNTCTCLLKNKKQCTKIATYKKGENYYCKKHSLEQKEWMLPTKENTATSIKKLKLQDLREMANKWSIVTETSKPQLLEKIIDHITKNTLEKIEKPINKKTQDMDLIQIGKNMTKLLNEIPNIETMTHIIMENQISPIATRMKTIQGMLAQYFIMKCQQETSIIEFISSANKLKGFFPTQKSSYKENKENSIVICSKIIESNECLHEWIEIMKTHKKKDDLYDAFLQGIWYLRNNKRIVCIEDKNTNAVILNINSMPLT
jgi:hypothetical protein